MISQAEAFYIAEHSRLINLAEGVLDRWIFEQAQQALTTDAEPEIIQRLRGIFDNPQNARAIFGKLAGLVNSDVETTLLATIPTFPRDKMIGSKRLEQFAKLNAELIRDVGSLIVQAVAKQILSGAGLHVDTLQRAFRKAASVSESRARLWARDQTLKLHSQITEERHKAVGIERYFWTDSNDERTRRIHRELGEASDFGTTYAYKDPPVMSEDGRRGNPGEDYQCRCTAFPVLG